MIEPVGNQLLLNLIHMVNRQGEVAFAFDYAEITVGQSRCKGAAMQDGYCFIGGPMPDLYRNADLCQVESPGSGVEVHLLQHASGPLTNTFRV